MDYQNQTLLDLLNESSQLADDNKLIIPVGFMQSNPKNKLDINYKPLYLNLNDIPNIIVSGTVGSGKTTFIQGLIVSLSRYYKSTQVKFIIFDSKGIDYTDFSFIPYMELPVVSSAEKLLRALSWVNSEAQKRITNLPELKDELGNGIQHVFVILDDYASIGRNPEINELIRKSIAISNRVKIHYIIVTSIPHSSILPSEIKASIPCRIVFSTASSRESKMILDDYGAEELIPPREFFYKNYNEKYKCLFPILSIEDIENSIVTVKENNSFGVDDPIIKEIMDRLKEAENKNASKQFTIGDRFDGLDPMFNSAAELAILIGEISTTTLQKKLHLGYARATRIIDQLEENGIISPSDGAVPRKVLITPEQWYEHIAQEESKKSVNEIINSYDYYKTISSEEPITIIDNSYHNEAIPDSVYPDKKKQKSQKKSSYFFKKLFKSK